MLYLTYVRSCGQSCRVDLFLLFNHFNHNICKQYGLHLKSPSTCIPSWQILQLIRQDNDTIFSPKEMEYAVGYILCSDTKLFFENQQIYLFSYIHSWCLIFDANNNVACFRFPEIHTNFCVHNKVVSSSASFFPRQFDVLCNQLCMPSGSAERNIFPSKKAHAEAHTHYFVTWCVTKLMAESERFQTHTHSFSLPHRYIYIAAAEKRIGASAESISARSRLSISCGLRPPPCASPFRHSSRTPGLSTSTHITHSHTYTQIHAHPAAASLK